MDHNRSGEQWVRGKDCFRICCCWHWPLTVALGGSNHTDVGSSHLQRGRTDPLNATILPRRVATTSQPQHCDHYGMHISNGGCKAMH